jgi:hypothetical protein
MTSIEKLAFAPSRKKAAFPVLASAVLLAMAMIIPGCSTGSSINTKTTTTTSQPAGPQNFMAPYIIGGTTPADSVATYTIDDIALTFSESTYYLGEAGAANQEGIRTYYAGTTTSLARGLLALGLTYNWNSNDPVNYNPPQSGGWAFELPDQAGALIQIQGQPFAPLVPAETCLGFTTPQTYEFITLPAPTLKGKSQPDTWNPTEETAFGSVEISGSGSTITFNNIQQYTLPTASGGAPGAPGVAVTSPQTGACSSTYYGSTTVVPANPTVTDPGPNSTSPPVALVGIGPTGLLVESNAASGEANKAPYYQDLLGAGTGAIGFPTPSGALNTSALVGAQYLGFFYGSGTRAGNTWSTYAASFGFATLPQDCSAVAAQTSTMIYGGDFPENNPGGSGVQSSGGFGNCDFAIDLGTEDPNNNGLYPAATVYVGALYAGNGLFMNYSFPALAIAGQLGGKYAIFLLGVDTVGTPNQAWGIYLLQSN